MNDSVRDSYDANAELYTELFLDALDHVPEDRERLAAFAGLARQRTGVVADVGCGPGHVVHFLTDLGVPAVGYDIAPEMIATARHTFPDSTFHVGDLAALDIADASLAGIVSRYSLIHLPPTELPAVFREWSRVLEPGAPVLVALFAAESTARHGRPFDHAVVTAYELFAESVADELRGAGFDDVRIWIRPPRDGERNLDHATLIARRADP
ncbi:class I SAM-dependent methyltransferase [Ilumatobacter nonamiensis]|uniref:class I SAM-dependent methyltransferase n=1 Tax=Ilumatobacter nonamiensis TaxID=467093 RepID=UPI00034A1E53|nr:class I SAM-dependent methyltransferase [Ilumatobacter nonamiensis]